jgi:uncharacterized protein (TIGR02996 family)
MTPLEVELESALRAGSAASTAIALCRAWALVPSTRLAKLARAFSAQVHRASVPGANESEREAAWQELADREGAAALDTLLATPWGKKPKLASARLERFAKWGPDPRVVGHLLDLDTGARYPTEAGRRFWVDAYELMLEWGSVEAAERIPKELKAATPLDLIRQRALYEPLHARRAGRWPKEPVLGPEHLSLLEQLEKRLAPTTQTRDGLIAAVYAAPRDDGPRLVLADALTEQGDPRGEFIALQLAHARGELSMAKREQMQRLLSASGRAWYDGLDGQVDPVAVFHKGFLHEVSLATRTPDPALPAWATVEVLRTGGLAVALSDFLAHPNLRSVSRLGGVRGESLIELARRGGERTFAALEVSHLGSRELPAPAWKVETLRLEAQLDHAVWWLEGGGLAGKVETIALPVRAAYERVGALITQFERLDPAIQKLDLASMPPLWPKLWHGEWLMRFGRNVRGRFNALSLSLGDEALFGLEEALSSFEKDQLESLHVTVLLGRGPTWRDSARELIARATKQQRRLKKVEIEIDKPVKLPPRAIISTGT